MSDHSFKKIFDIGSGNKIDATLSKLMKGDTVNHGILEGGRLFKPPLAPVSPCPCQLILHLLVLHRTVWLSGLWA